MIRITAAISIASWLVTIAIAASTQQLTAWIMAPFVIGILSFSLVAARVVGRAEKSQRNSLAMLLVAPAIIGGATVPLYASLPVLAFSLLAGAFAVVTVVLAVAAEKRAA